jgi:hypothetical protein
MRAHLVGILALLAVLVGGPGLPAAADHNACGCYRTDSGSCYCEKKAKCGCPGDCEPKGCEEKRQKEIDKEIQSETKRAKASEHGHGGEEAGKGAAPAEKAPKAGKALTAAQLHELARLLDLYVSEHPDETGKPIDQLARELARSK